MKNLQFTEYRHIAGGMGDGLGMERELIQEAIEAVSICLEKDSDLFAEDQLESCTLAEAALKWKRTNERILGLLKSQLNQLLEEQ